MKALVIDDSGTMRKILSKALIDLGCEDPLEAEDGVDALQKLAVADFAVDLILCDWNMPTMDGMAFLKNLRRDAARPKIPVIFVTTEAGKSRVIEALRAGADGYLIKPFTPAALKAQIVKVVGRGSDDDPEKELR